MKLLKSKVTFIPSNTSGVSVANFKINQNNEEFMTHRINLNNSNPIKTLIRKFTSFSSSNKLSDTEGLIKKTVRVDTDIHRALFCETEVKEFVTHKGNSAVIEKIKTKEIDVIRTKGFRHRITLYFTQNEYELVKDVVRQVKNKGLNFFTFSLLIRSILYEHFNIVSEVEVLSDVA